MPIRRNERSEVIELISEINQMVSRIDINIKRAGGENTLQSGGRTMFPDIILFGDTERMQILHGWEAKMPDVPITDAALISNAEIKANTLGVNSFVLWNFTAARVYEKNNNDFFEVIKRWDLPQIRNREDVQLYETQWKQMLHEIVLLLNGYFISGRLHSSNLDAILMDGIGVELIRRNKASVALALQHANITDTSIGACIQDWWEQAHVEYFKDETDPYMAYAKSILLHWLNRVIFAHLLKRYFNPAREVDTIDTGTTTSQANTIFERITSSCDFYNIFKDRKYDELLSEAAWVDVLTINSFLKENDITTLSQEVLQNILENTVKTGKREINGQFSTPSNLADILVRITLRNMQGDFFDPCCGTGTIAKAAKDYKKERIDSFDAISTIWAEDKDEFATQLAQLALSDVAGMNIPTRIFQNNIFDLQVSSLINFVNPSDGTTMNLTLPQFDAIASNLPFVAFENITDEQKTVIERLSAEVGINATQLDGRGDLYIPIVFALWKHLKENAFLGIITSNSWLATKAGKQFYNAVTHYYNIDQVHISGNGKWFENADIVTTIIILNKKNTIAPPEENCETTFFLWKKKLADFSDNLIKQKLINSALQNRAADNNAVSARKYSHSDIMRLENININKNALFHDIKWALDIEDKICPLKNIFTVFRGERRGWDKMFYPSSGHMIEELFIKPVLKSAKAVNSLVAEADAEAFCCGKTLTQLTASSNFGALNWIGRFMHECNEKGKPLVDSLKRANLHWYEMSDRNAADIVTAMNPETRLFYASFETPTFINQRLIGLRYKDSAINKDLCHALLNTILGMFFIEVCGFGRGLGVLDINKTGIESGFMLNPSLLTEQSAREIITAFQPLKQRDIKKTEDELQSNDRLSFDCCVLRAYGIEEYYERIKESLLSMQRARLSVKR